MIKNRFEVLKSLVEFSCPLETINTAILEFEWDYEGEPIELRREHLINVIDRYTRGDLSASEVEQWANLLEGREDISFEKNSEEWISKLIYELANPSITVPLNKDHARTLLAE